MAYWCMHVTFFALHWCICMTRLAGAKLWWVGGGTLAV